ncbi:histone-like nucleoid-structuring protein Lsr2 [Granulicoccus phenolivorans]|uniref:histone-like nucleoid-structuring protein Lsr2 n=1 Tax=Granulicoccus phenolivorans TaxID=266854 RepID=UPI0003F893AA|nr:Lsr2 family protein [Granulicoccus phenolivorans]
MAQRVILEDDLDGTTPAETLRFSIDGADYEIDLSNDNAKRLREAMDPWVRNARRDGRKRAVRTRAEQGTPTDIRAWARANGWPVNDRGRVPQEIREAYERAN